MKTILVADDKIEYLDNLIEALREKYNVVTAKSGNQAVEAISKGGLDLLILDNSMPPGDCGIEIAMRLKRQQPQLPVVVYTASAHGKTIYEDKEKMGIKMCCKHFGEKAMIEYVKQTLEGGEK